MGASIPQFYLLLISSWIKFWFITVVSKYLNFAPFSKDLKSTLVIKLQFLINNAQSHDHSVCSVLSGIK